MSAGRQNLELDSRGRKRARGTASYRLIYNLFYQLYGVVDLRVHDAISIYEGTDTMKTLYTIGYTQKSAEKFFSLLKANGIQKVIDIRLYNNTQLAGFTKQDSLQYFLKELLGIEYRYIPSMAPSKDIFNDSKKNGLQWQDYELRFNRLIINRRIERLISESEIDHACLLCCEPTAINCHRRLVAEYLQQNFDGVEVIHI